MPLIDEDGWFTESGHKLAEAIVERRRMERPTFADVEAKLREAGKEKQALGESLRHQRAAEHEIACFNWTARAERFLEHTDLDDDAFAHAVYVLAGAYREVCEQAIAECEVAFLEERRAGQR